MGVFREEFRVYLGEVFNKPIYSCPVGAIGTFENNHEVSVDVLKFTREEMLRGKNVTIDVFGSTLYSTWPMLREEFFDNNTIGRHGYKNISIRLVLINWDSSFKAIDLGGLHWRGQSEQFRDEFENYKKLRSNVLAQNAINIDFQTYNFLPTFHGWLVSNRFLYMSFCTWDDEVKELRAAENPYLKFDTQNTDQITQLYSNTFKKWFDFAWSERSKATTA